MQRHGAELGAAISVQRLGASTRAGSAAMMAAGAAAFAGAGSPRPELLPDEVPELLMRALQKNDFPEDF